MIKTVFLLSMALSLSACQSLNNDTFGKKPMGKNTYEIVQPQNKNLGIVILKLDDLRYDDSYELGVRTGWVDTFKLLDSYQLKGSIGIIAEDSSDLNPDNQSDAEHISYVSSLHANGHEVWHHGWNHQRDGEKGEFCEHPYERQKRHFDDAMSLIKAKYGITMQSLGTPYNCSDEAFTKVFEEQDTIKVFMLGDDPLPSNALNLDKRRVRIESSTGEPDFEYFKDKYIDNLDEEYYLLQGHPKRWEAGSNELHEFSKIIEFLITQGHVFMTPYQYYLHVSSPVQPLVEDALPK